MKTILFLHEESGSPNGRLQNVPGSRTTQRPSEAEDGSKADRELLDWLDSNFVKIELGNGMEPILAVEDLRTAIVARKKSRPF